MMMRGVIMLGLALAASGAEISQVQLREVVAQAGAKLDVGELDLSTFSYYTYEDIVAEVKELQADYPDLVNAYTAQEKYGLPSSAQCGDAPCEQWVLEITNKATLPEPARPQVFFSGALHGDERVGPSTAMEFMKLILQEYTEGKNMWIKRLVDTRTIVIMPATNAQGYHEASRTEGGVDVNRDFPVDTTNCMQTISARALNEVWRDHLFQTAITFHGGIHMIVYEWGTVPRSIQTSPDDNAQKQLGASMSAYAGAFDEGLYPHGAINELLYPVTGGMEDWAYAGSWLGRTDPCNTTTFGGYPIERTIYNDTVLRSFNILVETSDDKTPNLDTLGGPAHVLRPEGQNDGHIPRNLRLMLLTADLVEPYVQWVAWDNDVAYAWEVGGAMHVDETYLRYTYETEDGEIVEAQTTSQSGPTRWSGGGRADSADKSLNQDLVNGEDIKLNATDNIDDRAVWPFINAFEAQLELPEGAVIVSVVAEAVVDQTWALQPNEPSPNITPQSHMVNARIIDGYYATNAGYEVKGKKTWSSDVVVFEPETAAPTLVEPETDAPTFVEPETDAPTFVEPETEVPTEESAAQSQSPGHFVLVFSTLFFLGLMA